MFASQPTSSDLLLWFPMVSIFGIISTFPPFWSAEHLEDFEPFEHFEQSVWFLFHHFSQVPSAKSGEAVELAITATLRSSDLGHVRCRRLPPGQFEYRWSWKATNKWDVSMVFGSVWP